MTSFAIRMGRLHQYARSLLLLAVGLGLNLCGIAYLHAHRAGHLAHVNYGHVPSHGQHRPQSRTRLSSSGAGTSAQADHHVAPKSKSVPPALAMLPVAMPPVVFSVEPLLARINVLALGAAPRAPGSPRAPPVSLLSLSSAA